MISTILLPMPDHRLPGGRLLAAWHDHVPGYQFTAGRFAHFVRHAARSAPPRGRDHQLI
ncbi:hypothetical protein IQ251_19475 [Saccharopolyspora sp. HNM0983]|uniref:Uncharacterized protein n=1 Tax=Saccharopolyspora montiporae TaxID=2781240 RepID=A0A929BD95_9PSEU|nr:hypothetical protein [Saccharopolyspora sp. HNM0983]MBE9376635.1 hypothetical protein [Saccharopolyspora sp. HNM0983]